MVPQMGKIIPEMGGNEKRAGNKRTGFPGITNVNG
jgi:hypothetical protein